MGLDVIPKAIRRRFSVEERDHACAILAEDFPSEFADLMDCLAAYYGGSTFAILYWVTQIAVQPGSCLRRVFEAGSLEPSGECPVKAHSPGQVRHPGPFDGRVRTELV